MMLPHDRAVVLAGRYELSGVLGVGGMGTVYRARDRELEEVVALKVLRRELVAHPGMIERFRREVKLARRVTHRNVARVFDIGEHAGEKFLTMELVEGESLGARMARERPLPVTDVVALATGIVEGLGAAHVAGVVHRDLKPDNVLVTPKGRVVLTDFGIARAVAYAGQAGRTLGFVVGTPEYMAPEQIENAAVIDGRADLYALGVMLFEMLTGEPPFKGDSALAIVSARLVSAPPDPRRLVPDIPDALARLVLQLLARSPAERPESAAAVASALGGLTLPAVGVRRPSVRPGPLARGAARAIAVVPLATSDADLAWLGHGISELVADALDGRVGVDVRARGARLIDVAHRPLESLGEHLGVPLVVGGSLDGAGDDVRGELRLVNARDGFVLWSRRFDARIRTAMLAATAAAADDIARVLLLGSREHITTSADETAVSACLRARWEAARGGSDGRDRAIALYEHATARAPDDPWISASYALALAGRLPETELPGEADDAVAMATNAVARAPGLAAAHLALAEIHVDRGRLVDAARSLVVARSRAPSSADGERLLGHLLLACGEIPAALQALRSASTREVPSWRASWDETRALAFLGRFAEAESALEAGAERDAHGFAPWLGRVRFALWRGDDAALASHASHLASAIVAERELVSAVVEVGAGRGSLASALAHIEAQSRRCGRSRAKRSFLLQLAVELAASAGDVVRAEALLDRAVDDLGVDIGWVERCPVFEPLRSRGIVSSITVRLRARAAEVLDALRTSHETLQGGSPR